MTLYQNDWSPRELQAIGIWAEKSLSKLRRIQEIIPQQIELTQRLLTGKQKDEAVWRLQRMDLILSAAIYKKCFGE